MLLTTRPTRPATILSTSADPALWRVPQHWRGPLLQLPERPGETTAKATRAFGNIFEERSLTKVVDENFLLKMWKSNDVGHLIWLNSQVTEEM